MRVLERIKPREGFYKELLHLMLPIAVQNLITSAVSFADVLMVGQLNQTASELYLLWPDFGDHDHGSAVLGQGRPQDPFQDPGLGAVYFDGFMHSVHSAGARRSQNGDAVLDE